MYKVTNTGIYAKMIIKVRGQAVFYLRTKKIEGRMRTQKEHLHTQFHDWVDTEKEADEVYKARRAL